jgi:hypothetical protein
MRPFTRGCRRPPPPRHLARLHFVADDEVALLDLEAARAEHAAFVQARVEPGEIGHALRAHVISAASYGTTVPPAS